MKERFHLLVLSLVDCQQAAMGKVKARTKELHPDLPCETGTLTLGPSFVAFLRMLAGSWIRNGVGHRLVPIWDATIANSGFTSYSITPAYRISI